MKSTSRSIKRMPNEKYYTPHSVTAALLNAESFAEPAWDPGAGAGHILDALTIFGINCYGSDIAPDRADVMEADFFAYRPLLAPNTILGNPPYGSQGSLAVRFIERSLELTQHNRGKVAMLLHSDFDSGKTRRHLFDDHQAYARKYTLTDRIYWANFEEHTERSSTNHAWYVWDWSPRFSPRPTQHWLHAPAGGFR